MITPPAADVVRGGVSYLEGLIMSESSGVLRRIDWPECCGFVRIFESLRLCLQRSSLMAAFCGVFLTYMAGHLLDAVWSDASLPVVDRGSIASVNELQFFVAQDVNAAAETADWIEEQTAGDGDVPRTGVFTLLLHHARVTTNELTFSAVRLCPGGIIDAFESGLRGVAWLVCFHAWYAVLFSVLLIVIWGLCGGAICRSVALRIALDERIGLCEAFGYARSRFVNFALAPILPVAFTLACAAVLWVGGWVGAIPFVGELLVGVLFVVALGVGLVTAVLIMGGLVGFPLLAPAIATDNQDAIDAFSTIYSYVFGRPWKTVFYALVAGCFGALCVVLAKLLVTVTLWAVGTFMGASMNHGGAYAVDAEGERVKIEHKLDAMWQKHSMTENTPFYGTFGDEELRHVSWFGRVCLKAWIYSLWGLVAAFAVSFFYSASSIIYFLLRRDVDLTDIEDVFVETPPSQGASEAASQAQET